MEDTKNLLARARKRYTQHQVAEYLQVNTRTVKRWEAGETEPPPYAAQVLQQWLFRDNVPKAATDFTFIDLFAGIGGIRMGFEVHGGKCVFTSEWDVQCQRTYRANFGESHPIAGDITQVNAANIPDHDVLLAGFPCQPFSIAGVSKKKSLGRKHGFLCETQGTLFFDVARIIDEKRPKAFLLENVKNLISHDHGQTFDVIRKTLTEKLGYHIDYKVMDGRHWVPQHRERILIVGFREPTGFNWEDFALPSDNQVPRMRCILHPEDGSEDAEEPYTIGSHAAVNPKYILSKKLWSYLKAYAEKHRQKGNGFGYGLVGPDDVARTLSARYYKDGSEILISRGRKNPRRLTPRECARLMGFDSKKRKFLIPVSDTQAYRQFGNSVVVPVMEETARIMKPHVMDLIEYDQTGAMQLRLGAG
ncbi:MAG: DNA (cytosine-5-)-methyltransferase [Ktedonobacteraceae bacterium]